MASKYYLTLTTYGSDLIAQAHESAPLNLKNLVIGDANGVPYDPLTAIDRTHLVNQKASVLIQHLEVIDDVVRIQATVGANIGGFNIHEIGLTDETGKLVYIGNYHGGYKSLFEDGAGGELTISIDIKGVAANQINLSIDPNINTATQAWINENFIPRDEITDNLTTDDPNRPVSAAQAKNLQDNKLDKTDVVDLLTSTDSKKALSANAGRSLFQMFLNSHEVNGYQKIANPIDPNKPLIIQWGVQSESIIGTFPIAFPNEAFVVVASAKMEYAPWDGSVTTSWIISKTQFRVGCGQINGNPLYWVAMGN